MAAYIPGNLKKNLLDKVRATQAEEELDTPVAIKKVAPASYAATPAEYAASQMRSIYSSVSSARSTQPAPESILKKPVHERMKDFVTQQYKKK